MESEFYCEEGINLCSENTKLSLSRVDSAVQRTVPACVLPHTISTSTIQHSPRHQGPLIDK